MTPATCFRRISEKNVDQGTKVQKRRPDLADINKSHRSATDDRRNGFCRLSEAEQRAKQNISAVPSLAMSVFESASPASGVCSERFAVRADRVWHRFRPVAKAPAPWRSGCHSLNRKSLELWRRPGIVVRICRFGSLARQQVGIFGGAPGDCCCYVFLSDYLYVNVNNHVSAIAKRLILVQYMRHYTCSCNPVSEEHQQDFPGYVVI
jgi:hypothetical protein